MRARYRITYLFGKILLWSLLILFVDSVSYPVWGEEVVDRLHGFAFTPKEGWSVILVDNAIVFHDSYRFVVVRGVRHDGNLQKAAKSWMAERKAMDSGFQPGRYVFRKVGKGIVLYGEGLDYPYALLPMMSVNFAFSGRTPPGNYREVTAILPGEKYALVVTFLFPQDTPRAKLDDMTALLRSLRFLTPQQLVKWRVERVMDPEVNMEAATVHVPEGYEFHGTVIHQGSARLPFLWIQKGDSMMRIDHITVQTSVLQTGLGGSAVSLITVNGRSMQVQQAVVAQSSDDVVQMVLGLWQGETDREWTLKEKKDLPLTEAEQQQLAHSQQMAQGLQAMGAQMVNNQPVKVAIVAESGSLKRVALIMGVYGSSGRADWIASSQMEHISLTVRLYQSPASEYEQTVAIFRGVEASWRGNPAQALSALARFTTDQKRINDMVRQMTQAQREFNSQMATSWSNLLSDQTYIRDPQTSEISRVYKQSWETGGFWREPVFGDVLLSGVREGSKLEELLKSEGWRRMQESLEGFPQK